MCEDVDVCIIGGGPAGLSSAHYLAKQGCRVLLAERKQCIGEKVCAGGITWSGLLQHIPEDFIEQSFPSQKIVTGLQHCLVTEQNPIIATVNRTRLGQYMADLARSEGAQILNGTKVTDISEHTVTLASKKRPNRTIRFQHLIGADGAHSLVRRHLGLCTNKLGLGLNAQLPLQRKTMEWHFVPKLFGNGYSWIFPHKETCSIGAYAQYNTLSGRKLKEYLQLWAKKQHIEIPGNTIRAGLVNYDYQGHRFGHRWLVGEAAGLASGLTGEGIYPAIVSGQEVAQAILSPEYTTPRITQMVAKQKKHNRVLALSARHRLLSSVLVNLIVCAIRCKMVSFTELEMAD